MLKPPTCSHHKCGLVATVRSEMVDCGTTWYTYLCRGHDLVEASRALMIPTDVIDRAFAESRKAGDYEE